MQIYHYQEISWYQFQNLQQFPQLIQAVTTRGTSSQIFSMRLANPHSIENRRCMGEILGFNAEHLVVGHQVHGDHLTLVSAQDRGRGALSASETIPATDGLITTAEYVPIMSLSADCPLIALFDPKQKVLAVVHAGWRGTAQRIAYKAALTLQQTYGCSAQNIWAGIAPSIGPCCYEVGQEVAAIIQTLPSGDTWVEKRGQHWYLDLWSANQNQLIQAGIPSSHIEVAGLCSSCHVDQFFSYRKEGKAVGHIALLLMLKNSR